MAFREEQKLKGGWKAFMWLAGFLPADAVALLFAYGAYQQILLGEPFGNKPLPDVALLLVAVGSAVCAVLLAWLIMTMKLIVEIEEGHLVVRFSPLPAKRISLDDVQASAVVKNRMLGIGKQTLPNDTTYSMGSKQAVKLTFGDGRTLTLGSENPEQLVAAIEGAVAPVGAPPELSASETWMVIQQQKANDTEKQHS